MNMKLGELEDAFFFVNSAPPFTHSAVFSRDTGKFYYTSELGDIDEIPEDLDYEKCVEIPPQNDLDLGNVLVFEFVSDRLPDEINKVDRIFSHRGAYFRYKQMLEEKGLLDEWYTYENECTKRALRKWCEDEGIEVTG